MFKEFRINPTTKISNKIILYWRATAMVDAAKRLGAFVIFLFIYYEIPYRISLWWFIAISLYIAAKSLYEIVWEPSRLYESWRWDIDDEDIFYKSGIWRVTRSQITINRVSYVDTEEDFFERRYGISSLIITTSGGNHIIPGLIPEDAHRLREHISSLVKVGSEDDET